MKKAVVFGIGFLFLAALGMAAGARANSDYAYGTQVFIGQAALYGVSKHGILTIDLVSGKASIQYRDGNVFEWESEIEQQALDTLLKHGSMSLIRSVKPDGTVIALPGNCDGYAQTLQAATEATPSACGADPGSESCRAAQNLLRAALAACAACISAL